MAHLWRSCVLLMVMVVALAVAPARGAATGGAEAGPVQTDVILLLDRSGSMVKNDPQGLTDTGPQVFVDMLDPGDRVAVVAFDTDARVLLPLSPVGDGAAARKALTEMGRPAGQWTDIKAALAAAMEQLGQPSAERAPAVLLFTDGKPETQPDGVPPGYRDELTQLISQLAGRAVPVFTLGLGNADEETLGRIAAGTRAESFAATSAAQAVEVFTEVLSRVKERRVMLSFTEDLAPGVAGPVHSFQVPPYTRLLTLSGVATGGVALKGTAPGGAALEAAPGARLSRGANYAVLAIPNPAPGAWTVQLEGEGRAVAQAQAESSLRLTMVSPHPYSQVSRNGATDLEVAVIGDPDPQSPLELWAQAGASPAVRLTPAPGAAGKHTGTIAMGDGRLAVWAMRAGGEVARREFLFYPVDAAVPQAVAGAQPGQKAEPWPWLAAGAVAALGALLALGAANWRRIKRRDEQLAGRLGSHTLNGRGKTQLIGDLARLEARLVPRGWAPLAGLGLVRRELQIYIHQQSNGVRIQINNRPPGDGRLYHEDEVILGGETMIFTNPRLPRRPRSGTQRRTPLTKRPSGRPTLKG
ncbi:MAG TPA: vWA domain-containing protein [Symbiobacteriaceae bacterium]|nr:vWA domain-containing protein [Symbiobacteriaceae bacterium]